MSKVILQTTALVMASMFMAACSGGGKGSFTKACQATLVEEIGSKDETKIACTCMHTRLDEELSGKQMKMATEIMSFINQGEIEDYVRKHKGAELVSERVQGAMKSCASGGF